MKKGLLFILLAAASVCLPAQEKENAAKSYTVETNRFGANWFISGGIGAQMYFGDNDGKADFGKRLAPALYRLRLKTGEISNNFGEELGFPGASRELDGGAAILLEMPLNPDKKLSHLVLETLSNDVVIGLMGITLQR